MAIGGLDISGSRCVCGTSESHPRKGPVTLIYAYVYLHVGTDILTCQEEGDKYI